MFRIAVVRSAAAFALWAAILVLSVAPGIARETAKPQPALWKVDGPNGDIYLFGSIHLLPKGFAWRRPELDAALLQAQQLVFELDLDAAQDPKAKTLLIAKHGFLKPGESLRTMLAPEHVERLDAVVKSLGIEPATIDRMRPWLAAVTLNSYAIIKQNSKPGTAADAAVAMKHAAGVDAQLWTWAKAVGKERHMLETAEDQIRVFADLSREQELEYLIVTLQDVKRTHETLGSMIEAWTSGDTTRLDRAFNASMDGFPALRKAVLRDRHERWLPQIERMMSGGGTHVIVVGAAHLVGEDSVIAMLRAKGVTVEGP
jgi:uncharacterized protein YbaP (TraB family)